MATHEVRDPRMKSLVDEDAPFEKLATGFIFTEGPLWHPIEHHLTFSDMPGNIMRRWDGTRGVRTLRKPAAKCNGLVYDKAGRLIACQHATSKVVRYEESGAETVLASHWDGKELNSPNDIVVAHNGAIYFSDPTYGRMPHYGEPRDQQLKFQGVYRIDPASGAVQLMADDFGQPNGLCFTHDERTLFVNDTQRQHIRVFEVAADGSLKGGKVWAETKGSGGGAPDGMKLDALGNVWCCGPGGIHVFSPEGQSLGVLRGPEGVANFCFGDGDYRSLFVTATTSLYRVRTKVAGRPVF